MFFSKRLQVNFDLTDKAIVLNGAHINRVVIYESY